MVLHTFSSIHVISSNIIWLSRYFQPNYYIYNPPYMCTIYTRCCYIYCIILFIFKSIDDLVICLQDIQVRFNFIKCKFFLFYFFLDYWLSLNLISWNWKIQRLLKKRSFMWVGIFCCFVHVDVLLLF